MFVGVYYVCMYVCMYVILGAVNKERSELMRAVARQVCVCL
jgi:hypothetical protein